MDYPLILYILISVTVGLGGMVMLIKSDRTLGGLLFVVAAVLVFTFYGLRWFQGDTLKATRYKTTSWPPVINACPDFLTLHVRDTTGKKERVCVDMVGAANSGLKRFTDPFNINNDNYVFKLHDDKTGSARINALCNECKNKRVTWEGVYDGAACVAEAVPNASGGMDTNTTTGGGQCNN